MADSHAADPSGLRRNDFRHAAHMAQQAHQGLDNFRLSSDQMQVLDAGRKAWHPLT
jgi:hypothetical protein